MTSMASTPHGKPLSSTKSRQRWARPRYATVLVGPRITTRSKRSRPSRELPGTYSSCLFMARRPRGETRCAPAGSLGVPRGPLGGLLQAPLGAIGADQRTLDLSHPLGQGVQIAAYSASSARDNRQGFGNGVCALIQATALQYTGTTTASRATPAPAMGDSPRHSQASPCSTAAAAFKPESGARNPESYRRPVIGRCGVRTRIGRRLAVSVLPQFEIGAWSCE